MSELKFTACFVGGHELVVRTSDLRHFSAFVEKQILCSDGRRFRIRIGAESDGTSEPQLLWSLGLAPFGLEAPASFVHDCGYRGTLEILRDEQWVLAMLTKEECDDLYNSLMFSLGVDEKRRLIIYNGVRFMGWKSFRDDRSELNPK